MTKLSEPSRRELDLAYNLMTAVKRRANEEADKWLAEKLGLLSCGAQALLGRQRWSVGTAIRAAEAIGMNVTYNVILPDEEVDE